MLAAGTYTVTFRSAANGFVDSVGVPLDGANNGNPAGSNYVATFVVAASSPPVSVGIPAFARGPDSADPINLPNSATTGIPVNVSVGSGITSGKFTLQYNPALLSITGVAVNTSLTGASLSLDAASTAGTAILDFSSPTALTQTGALRLGGLVATVPNSAASLYKSKALLHWSGVTLNGGAIGAQGDDAVQIVAYFGDAAGTANGNLSGADASDISAVATSIGTNSALGTVGGFAAFPLADPAIIADLNNDGLVDSADVTLLNSVLAGIPRVQIPVIPTGLPIVASGPDPSLSLPAMLRVTPGGTAVVPVNIDSARPVGSTGATETILALEYNPRVFTLSATDVQLGSLTDGWQLTTVVNAQTGEIGIDLWSTTPIQTTAGGSLVTITLHVRDTAPRGQAELTLVNQVDPAGQRLFTTTVADAQGAFVLHPAMTAYGLEPGTPAIVTIGSTAAPLEDFVFSEMAPSSEGASLSLPVKSSAPASGLNVAATLFANATELVFGEAAQTAGLNQETSLGQPGPLLNTEPGDLAMADAHGNAVVVPSLSAAQTDWISDDYLAYLRESAKRPAGRIEVDGFEM